MTLEQLKTFIKIAELKSFSEAAKKVHLSQPSVSCHIISLEQELGTQLFDRLGKKIVITKQGRILLKYAKEIINLEKRARLAIDDVLDMKKGEIKLGSSNIPGAYILLPLIQKFNRENPQVKIISEIGDTQSITGKVIEGTLDLGVVGNKIDDNHLMYYDFVKDKMVLALKANHPLAKRSSITLEEFQTLPFLIREEGSGTRKTVEDILTKKGIGLNSLNIVAQLGNTEAIKQGIKAGLGVSILSRCAIYDEVKFGLIKYTAIEGLTFTRYFYIILPKIKSILPLIHFFKDFLLKYLPPDRNGKEW